MCLLRLVKNTNIVLEEMDLFFYIVVPAAISFLVQSILCHRVKTGTLRYGVLILPLIFAALGVVTLFTQSGGTFGGLGVLAAYLCFIVAFSAACGCGAAWLGYLVTRKWR